MTVYYVRKSGNDSNAGTSPAAAWLTIGKALGASGISSGDTVYIGPGVYREKATVAMTSAVAETFVIGDVTGAYTGDTPGEVRITNYLTNDSTASTQQSLIDLNGRDYLTFRNITFAKTTNTATQIYSIDATTEVSTNIKIQDCTFYMWDATGDGGNKGITVHFESDDVLHWEITRCIFFNVISSIAIDLIATDATVSDWDVDFVISNCLFMVMTNAPAVYMAGSTNVKPGGLIVKNCTHIGDTGLFETSNTSTTFPCYAYNNLIISGWTAYVFNAGVSGQIVENYNYIMASIPRNNVSTGANSISDGSFAPLLSMGQELQWGQRPRPYMTPVPGSPLLGFGNHASAPTTDAANRPRPAGGQSTLNAVGAYELHDTGTEETTVYDSAPSSMKIVGPGDHEFLIPVNPIATNITIMVRYDTNHAATNKPQVQLLANSSIGVSAETLTMTDGVDTWERLEFTTFVPTDYGVVTLRCLSRSAAGSGIAWFDSITV